MKYIEQSIPRVDAYAKVTGQAHYPDDFKLENPLHMKVKFSTRAHARVIKVDVSKAIQIPGVITVLSGADIPINEYGFMIYDQPVLCGPGCLRPYSDRVRTYGDKICCVLAETAVIATAAVEAIEVEYEDLPALYDPEEAMKADAYLIHPERENNILEHFSVRQGLPIADAFAKSDVIVEGVFQTPIQEHMYLQPEAGYAYFDEEERITVVAAGQNVHKDQEQVAHALGVAIDKVRVIYPAIGGSFGGREDQTVQIILAAAIHKLDALGLRRPVKIVLSRDETTWIHNKRHPYKLYAKWGATKDGKINAAEVKAIGDVGGYAYTSTKIQANVTICCIGPYAVPNTSVDTYSVFTNNFPTGAFRGFGGPQGSFEAEGMMDRLAQALDMDPVEFRLRNLLREGDKMFMNSEIPSGVSIVPVSEQCAIAAGWKKSANGWKKPELTQPQDTRIRRGIGFGCAMKNVGYSFGFQDTCNAKIELCGDKKIEKAIIYHGTTEVGQGGHTVIKQMAAEALDLPLEKIVLVLSDSATCKYAGSVSASRMTFMAGNSVIGAAKEALKKWEDEERPAIGEYCYYAPQTSKMTPGYGDSTPNFSYGYFAVAPIVNVNLENGLVTIEKITCVDDVGRAINMQLVEGQIEGALIQAAGYAVMENMLQHSGRFRTRNFSTYLIPTVLDIPDDVEIIVAEYPDPCGPWGARGLGEVPFLPFVPAIAAAIEDAIGLRIDEHPYTPERVLKAICAKK